MTVSARAGSACEVSVVVPMYNEAAALPLLHDRLQRVLGSLGMRFEIVYVDDGSTDGCESMLRQLHASSRDVSVVRFSRNFGKEAALSAGLQHARGDAVITLDADLQHPPEMIPQMLAKWRAGADVVDMRRRSRAGEPWWRRHAAGVFYGLIERLSETPIPRDVGDFRLLSRRAVDALNRLPERNRFMKGLFGWIGFESATIEFECDERVGGRSTWSVSRLLRFALAGLTAFSVAPLRLASLVGLVSAMVAFGMGAYYLVKTLMFGESVAGFPTLIVVMLMLGGLQLLAIGVLGEYVGRLSIESKQRPLFIVQDYLQAQDRAGSEP